MGGHAKQNIARYGHIATLIRTRMSQEDWTITEFSRAFTGETRPQLVHPWVNAKGAPSVQYRAKLAKFLGVPESELQPREEANTPPPEAQRLKRLPQAPREDGSRPGRDGLLFSVNETGTARIRLDASLPFDEATPLLRMLLDAGLVLGKGEDKS